MIQRIALIAAADFRNYLRRPMVWVWVVLLALLYWGLSTGNVRVATGGGDSAIGGTKQFINSEFEIARVLSAFTLLIHGFFASVLFGMSVIHDFDTGTMPLLHSTRLRTSEYLLAKILGCGLLVAFVLLANILLPIFFMHVLPHPERSEYIGPFAWSNYWQPVFKLVVPALVFTGLTAFALGTLTRKSILVFLFPTVNLLVFGLFLNSWSPIWLDVRVNHLLNCLDMSGMRWLEEVYFKVDRGANFYNAQPVVLDFPFLVSRIAYVLVGCGIFALTVPAFRRQLRGARHGRLSAVKASQAGLVRPQTSPFEAAGAKLAELQMQHRRSGLLRDFWNITRYELRELRHSPSLYLFVPIILLQAASTAFLKEGAFGTFNLQTPGKLAENEYGVLAILGCMLMMFHTVESQLRERSRRLAPIYYATQAKTFAVLMGKSLANVGIGIVLALTTLAMCAVVLLIQGTVAFSWQPFLLIWGSMLLPTYLVWTAFITLAVVLTRSRYTAYAIGAAALIGTLYLSLSSNMSWPYNWMGIGLIKWSDISVLEIDREALWLNRLLMLALSILFTYLATQFFWRRGSDAVQMATRLRLSKVTQSMLAAAPFLVVPLTLGIILWLLVAYGFQGRALRHRQHECWRQNVETWKGVEPPSISGVNIRLQIDPPNHSLAVTGVLRLSNDLDQPMSKFALTRGSHWKEVSWKFTGKAVTDGDRAKIPTGDDLPSYQPEDRTGLCVFRLDPPLQPGEATLVEYSFHGQVPNGITANGGGTNEFIMPSGVVLTSFGTSFVPYLGLVENAGFKENEQPESKVYDDNFYEDKLRPLFGGGDHFNVRTTITGPADFTFNGVGVKTSDQVSGDQRTVVWESDNPVSFFNVVGGRWLVREGAETEIYYAPEHPYNIEEMSQTLDAARTWYSRWFAPYPWRELKLSEFPGLASYAQGFATNITFSESIGFLTKDTPGSNAPFTVTAHEAAHQWWGNILVPGKGPGGNILSEGMAHFSAGLLTEQVKGLQARIAFFQWIEKSYGEQRSVDSERPMVKVDGSKDGDNTVIYDRGGWVFWMLLNRMGRENCLRGLQSFIKKYSEITDDYPVLQDFVIHMRGFADDPAAFDEFTGQWIFDRVVPEYKLSEVQKERDGDRWTITGSVSNVGTGKMPLEVCVSRGERFIGKDANPKYQQAKSTVVLDAGQTVTFTIQCDFDPEVVCVDPDALVLQLNRKLAVFRF